MPNARFELTEDDIRVAEDARRYLEYRAWERQGRRKQLRLALLAAMVPTLALTMWAWIGDGAPAWMALIVFLLLLAMWLPVGWVGVAAYYWILAVAEDAWDFLRGD